MPYLLSSPQFWTMRCDFSQGLSIYRSLISQTIWDLKIYVLVYSVSLQNISQNILIFINPSSSALSFSANGNLEVVILFSACSLKDKSQSSYFLQTSKMYPLQTINISFICFSMIRNVSLLFLYCCGFGPATTISLAVWALWAFGRRL